MEQPNKQKLNISAIIPVYNEEGIIAKTLGDLKKELAKLDVNYEIIVVDDGSTDKTKEILEKISGIKVVHHHYNRGNGAALKTGIKEAIFNNLLFFDADGQHKTEYIKEFLKYVDDYDMLAGARIGYKGPLIRQPGKKLLHGLANYLSKQKIPDINCGFRIVKKDKISKFTHLLCDGFSFQTTSLLVFINEDFTIKYIPITINKREGKSTVRPSDAFNTFVLILRMILLSSPLKIFLPITSLLVLLSIVALVVDLMRSYQTHLMDISEVTILLFIFSLLFFFFGLMADQLALIRKEIKK